MTGNILVWIDISFIEHKKMNVPATVDLLDVFQLRNPLTKAPRALVNDKPRLVQEKTAKTYLKWLS